MAASSMVLRGLVALVALAGAAAQCNPQCNNDQYCDTVNSNVCRAYGSVNGICLESGGFASQSCVDPLVCWRIGAQVGSGSDGTCKAYKNVGESCDGSAPCVYGAFCDDLNGAGTCKSDHSLAVGQQCRGYSGWCNIEQSYCDATANSTYQGTGLCTQRKVPGATCATGARECATAGGCPQINYCSINYPQINLCTARLPLDSTCTSDDKCQNCRYGANPTFCIKGKCKERQPENLDCEVDNHCGELGTRLDHRVSNLYCPSTDKCTVRPPPAPPPPPPPACVANVATGGACTHVCQCEGTVYSSSDIAAYSSSTTAPRFCEMGDSNKCVALIAIGQTGCRREGAPWQSTKSELDNTVQHGDRHCAQVGD